MPMGRTIVQLTPAQQAELRRRAKDQKVSVSELIRRAVDASLAVPAIDDERRKQALSVIGCAHSDTGDVSQRHDEYFADSILEG